MLLLTLLRDYLRIAHHSGGTQFLWFRCAENAIPWGGAGTKYVESYSFRKQSSLMCLQFIELLFELFKLLSSLAQLAFRC